MVGRLASLIDRTDALWARLPDSVRAKMRTYSPVAASLAVNGVFVLALTAFASGVVAPREKTIEVELIAEAPKPELPPDLPPPPPTSKARAAETRPAQPPAGPVPVAPPSTPQPSRQQGKPDADVEIDPSDFGIPGMASVAPGLKSRPGVDACADPDPRKRPAGCGASWREGTNAFNEREAREWRAAMMKQQAKELGVYNDCGSSHLGCAPRPDKTLSGAAPVTRRGGMGPGGPSGTDQPELHKPNAYHVDPGFGD